MVSLEEILKNAKRFLGIGLLSALSLLPLKNVDAADWWWGKIGDTGMEVRVNDTYYGNAERIEFGHKVENVNSWPTVAVFYSDGAIRLKEPQDPDNFFGTSFYPGPAYWSDNNYYSNPTIEKIEVSGDFEQGPFDIKLTGRNNDFDVVYDLKMYSPKQNNNKMVLRVKQSYNCNNDVTIDSNRQDLHEGFKIAKLTSMYINNNYHDSDSARYINDLEELVNSNFNDFLINGFIFTDPNKMGKPWIEATHSDDDGWQFNTPNVRIQVEGSLANYTPQGFFTQTIDYNDDNISLWINNDNASAFFVNDTNTIAYWIVSQDNPYSASIIENSLDGLCYGPFRTGQSPDYSIFPSENEIKEDLSIISKITSKIRTYGNDHVLYEIPRLSNDIGIDCYPGAWISGNELLNDEYIQDLISIANQNYLTTKALVVGNEVMLRGDVSEAKLIDYINQVKNATALPVTTVETWDKWLQHPNLADIVDYLLVNIHPYWEGISVNNAAQHVIDKWNVVKQTYLGKEVIISETGWPSDGNAYGSAVPSEANQKRFLTEFLELARENYVDYFFFEAFDEPWKTAHEGSVGDNWGVYYENRISKPSIEDILEGINDFKQHSGVNLPWGRGTYGGTYGHSVGDNPYGEHDGFSSSIGRKNLIEDFYFMKSKGVKLSRVFIFCDARSGFEYENENVTSLDSYVGKDMQTLLDIANAHNIKIMPVLFDYMLADGVQWEWGSRVGEHPEFITDTEKKDQLFENALRPFIRGFGNHNAVYAWEIINEPEYASAVSQDPLRNFFVELTDLIKEEVPNAIVTVGSDKRSDVDLWVNPIMSLDQFHHYDYMGSLDYLASKVSYNPILIGEVQPVNVIDKLETISRNNYKGALFWSLNADYDFKAVADEFKNWMTSDDLDAPAKISGLTAEDTLNDNGGSINLSWNANSEQDVDHYNVYRSIGTIEDVIGMTRIESVNTNSFTDSSTVDGTDYYYAVTAVDNSGNEYFIVDDFGPAKSIDNIVEDGEGNGGSGGGGCFIATAAYGTTQAQEVNILSKFRDGYLIKNPLGKVFVNQYYRLSPAIADKIKDTEVLKKMIRIGLKPVISVLKKLEI